MEKAFKCKREFLCFEARVKNIHLVNGIHNINCKIDGFVAMKLKLEFVNKL